MRRKSPKTHQGPPGPWTPGEGGVAPFDPPTLCPSGIGCDSLNPQASSMASLPSHGLKTESVPFMEPKEKKKTDLSTSSKWQVGLFLWQKVARREPEQSGASAKRAVTTHQGIPKGAALGAPLVTFPATGKSPGVEGRSALLIGRSAEEGSHLWCTPPRIVKLGDAVALPVKNYPNNSVQISGISGSSVRTTSLPKSSVVSPSRRRRATTTSRASANS